MKLVLLSLLTFCSLYAQQSRNWNVALDDSLNRFGHRNWIVIADSAYPLQSSPGIETVVSTQGQIETVRTVFAALARRRHLRPVVYTDRELQFVPEPDAVGIGAYRQLLSGVFETFLHDQKPNTIPHETIIHNLDEASKTFNVLIIKTDMALPYTSVFLELRAGYWDDEAERRMREKIP